MFFKPIFRKPILLLFFSLIVIIGFFSFGSIKYLIDLWSLQNISQNMQRNYFILQSLLLAKVWGDKFAMYNDQKIGAHFGPAGINSKLLARAENIARANKIDLKAHFKLLTYFYKENNGRDPIMGFVGFDCAGISYKNRFKKVNQGK